LKNKRDFIFIFFTSFFYPPPLVSVLPLVWPVFHSCPLGLFVIKHTVFLN
jgi:hypothetical protein